MPSDADYLAMALARNPEQFTPEQAAEARKVIDAEIAQERKENEERWLKAKVQQAGREAVDKLI